MSDASTLTAVTTVPLRHTTKDFKFGFLLDEMAIPVEALLAHGCTVVYANPTGVEPPRDASGDDALYFTDGVPTGAPGASALSAAAAKLRLDKLVPTAAARAELAAALELVTSPDSPVRGKGPGSFDTPRRFADFLGADGEAAPDTLSGFDAVFIPGGYAPMLNLYNDPQLGAILRWFHAQERLTVTLCRGGVGLRSAATADGAWIYAGYKMTTYSTVEDDVASLVGKVLPLWDLPFHPNAKLKELGADVGFTPFQSHTVEDRELLTGENQWSAHELADRFLKRLGR
jgi:putative intracellular protease/amidase